MGYLFENMEKMDIQMERQLRQKAQAELEAERERGKQTQDNLKRAQEALSRQAEEMFKENCRTYLEVLQEFAVSRAETKARLMEKYGLEAADAEEKLALYWKE